MKTQDIVVYHGNSQRPKKPKRGRKRFFDAVLYKLRFTIERTFAWKDKFKRLLLR